MKIASFSKKITPECGTLIAGYGPHDVSVAIHDDLYLSGICLDDNGHKALVISYDLLGMDAWYVQEIRQKCAEIISGQEADVLLTCTHTHGGPSTRSVKSKVPDDKIAHQIIDWTVEAVRNIGPFTECDAYFYSGQCNMNINRRITSNYNVCVQLSGNRDQEAMANGYCDRELGMIMEGATKFCKENEIPASTAAQLRLAVEELCVVTVAQAFSGKPGEYIRVTLAEEKGPRYMLHIRNSAPYFNPLDMRMERARTDMTAEVMDSMGVLIVKKQAKNFSYRNYQGYNVMTVEY